MNYKNYTAAVTFIALLAAPAYADNKDARAMMNRSDAQKTDALMQSARSCLQANNAKIPAGKLSSAQCVAIFPKVTSAALVVGGAHGNGVVTCKGADNKWSRPGFLDLTGASIGAQAGAKQGDLVLLFMNEKARTALNKGSITFGADVTATLGSSDVGAEINTAGADVVAYASESGLFAGAALNGVRISPDQSDLDEYYKEVTTFQKTIANFDQASVPATGKDLIDTLQKQNS